MQLLRIDLEKIFSHIVEKTGSRLKPTMKIEDTIFQISTLCYKQDIT